MIKLTFTVAVFALSVLLNPLMAATPTDKVTDLAQLLPETGEIHLGLYSGDTRDGFMRLGWYREEGDLVVYDRSLLSSQEVYETFSSRMDANDLSPKSIQIRFHSRSNIAYTDISFDVDKATGERRIHRPGQEDQTSIIDVDLPESIMLRAMSFIIPLVLPQADGAEFSYSWFAPMSRVPIAGVKLTAHDGGVIETPAGSFDTVRFELRGSNPDNDIYVTRGDTPQVVRIDVLGTPLKFMAVTEEN